MSLCVAAAGIALATWMYARPAQPVADRLAARFGALHRAAYHRFYIDEVYQFVTHRVIFACISTPIAWFDRHVVDGFMNLLATATNGAAVPSARCRAAACSATASGCWAVRWGS